MRMHKIALLVVVAVAGIPAGALAAKPAHPTTPASANANANANATTTTTATTATTSTTKGKSAAAKVQFVLRGTLSAYTAATSATNGTISLTVKGSNFDSKTLKGTTLVFVVTSTTKLGLHNGAAIANGDNGIVKLRLAKNNSVWTGLSASQVIDQGAPRG
jgi:hypothetical protein